jgi:hypothetical protein
MTSKVTNHGHSWKAKSPVGDEISFDILPGGCVVVLRRKSMVRQGKILKGKKETACAIGSFSREDAISLAHVLLERYVREQVPPGRCE